MNSSFNSTATELLHLYITYHNLGVETKNFDKLFELFSQNAEIHFDNINFGPLIGLKSIMPAFQTNPPTDKLIIQNENLISKDTILASYSWNKKSDLIIGEIQLESKNNLIKRLFIKTFL